MRSSRPPVDASGHVRRVGVAALIALSVGLVVIVVGQGFSSVGAVRALEDVALGVIVAAALMALVAFLAVRLAGWRDPESETEFEQLVRHSEELAREGLAADPTEGQFLELDPLDDDDFEELVRDALDDLPDLLRNAPHTAAMLLREPWTQPYSREEAAYPVPELRGEKYWPPVRRIDGGYGDRNLMCSCPPVSSYE